MKFGNLFPIFFLISPRIVLEFSDTVNKFKGTTLSPAQYIFKLRMATEETDEIQGD